MARIRLKAAIAALALGTSACNLQPDQPAEQGSVTVKLPPPRPPGPAPAFRGVANGRNPAQSP